MLDGTKSTLSDIKKYMYFIKEVNLDLRLNGEPVILGFQFQSDYLMIPLKLSKKGDIEIINDHVGLKREVCHRTFYHNQAVWTIDRVGNIFKIELNESLKVETGNTGQSLSAKTSQRSDKK
jgi:hypothetical protein